MKLSVSFRSISKLLLLCIEVKQKCLFSSGLPLKAFSSEIPFWLKISTYLISLVGSKSGQYEEIRERPLTKLLTNGSLLLQHVKEDREGFYLCQANNGIGTGIGKVIQLKVNCKCPIGGREASANFLNGLK